MIINMKNKTFMTLSRLSIVFLILFFVLSLSACVKRGSAKRNKYAPPKQEVAQIVPKYNGAIYQEGMPLSLFEDTTARRKGDVVTIKLIEAASALASSDTKASKEQNVELPPPKIAGGSVTQNDKQVLENQVAAGRDFTGSGESNQAHNFQAVIAVSVVDVLPNNYLVVSGEKLISLNQSNDFIRFSGIIRPQDIALDNTIESQKVANVKISYAGQGVLHSSNTMGPLAKFFQSPAYPY